MIRFPHKLYEIALMKQIIGIIFIFAGGWLVYTGYSEADSIAGKARTKLIDLKNDIDGKNRTPRQYWYYGSGALLIVAGAGLVMRKN